MRVKRTTCVELSEAVPVFDLTVHGTENFCLGNGIVVHNSKDVADAVTGALSFALQSRKVRNKSAFVQEQTRPSTHQSFPGGPEHTIPAPPEKVRVRRDTIRKRR